MKVGKVHSHNQPFPGDGDLLIGTCGMWVANDIGRLIYNFLDSLRFFLRRRKSYS